MCKDVFFFSLLLLGIPSLPPSKVVEYILRAMYNRFEFALDTRLTRVAITFSPPSFLSVYRHGVVTSMEKGRERIFLECFEVVSRGWYKG